MEMILPDIISAGIYNSNFVHRDKTITKNRKTTMFEIEIPIENTGVSYIGDRERRINTNMIICAKPGQIRHTKLPYKCYYIHMILKDGKLYEILKNTPDYINVSYDKYCAIFSEICKLFESLQENDRIMLNSLILKLIYNISEESKKQLYRYKAKKNNYEVIENALSFINENITDDLTLEAVAKYVSLSPIHFHNCFKAAIGKTLHAYVEEQRIAKAANMLVSTDKTLAETAYLCGFSSQSYFSFAFKRKMKMTPREYVKKICNRYDCID